MSWYFLFFKNEDAANLNEVKNCLKFNTGFYFSSFTAFAVTFCVTNATSCTQNFSFMAKTFCLIINFNYIDTALTVDYKYKPNLH